MDFFPCPDLQWLVSSSANHQIGHFMGNAKFLFLWKTVEEARLKMEALSPTLMEEFMDTIRHALDLVQAFCMYKTKNSVQDFQNLRFQEFP